MRVQERIRFSMTRMDVVLPTDRTRLRPFAVSDAESLFAIFRDSDVRRYLLDDELVTAEWVRDEITSSEFRFAESGTGLWSIQLRPGPEVIGFAGFRDFFDPPQLQLLYGLLPQYWGQGFATEAAARICEYAFAELDFPAINSAIDTPNEASARVLERLGMKLIRTNDAGVAGTAFYELERDEWLSNLMNGSS